MKIKLFLFKHGLLLFSNKTIMEFCEWSKEAEWIDGDKKTSFVKSDWNMYIKLFLKDNKYRDRLKENIEEKK